MKPVIVPFFIAHQGCPHTCVFCNQVKIAGGTAALPEPAELLARIAAYRETAGARKMEAAFYGGTFTSLPLSAQERLLSSLQPLLADGRLSSVRVSTRPDAVDRATAEFLRAQGVETVELGVQSLDDAVLARSGRGHTARDAEDARRTLADAGMRVGFQLMAGLPGDTPATAHATMRRAVGLKPDFFRIYPTLVIAGTELERIYRAGGYIPLTLPEAVTLCKVLLHEALRAAIPVVRIGLQAADELRPGDTVVAGPYHPAFRQLVEAELFFDLMVKLTADVPAGERVTFACSPARLSEVGGQNRANVRRLRDAQGVEIAEIVADPRLASRELRMAGDNLTRTGDLLRDLHYIEGGCFPCLIPRFAPDSYRSSAAPTSGSRPC